MPDRELERARKLARILDHDLVDPLLGLFLPVVGDVLGSVFGLYIVVVAVRRRISPVVIARMVINLGVDVMVGVIPIIGDVFDFFFQANRKNLALLVERSATGGRAHLRDWFALAVAVSLFLAVIVGTLWGLVALVRHL